jgi:hypothetical protein
MADSLPPYTASPAPLLPAFLRSPLLLHRTRSRRVLQPSRLPALSTAHPHSYRVQRIHLDSDCSSVEVVAPRPAPPHCGPSRMSTHPIRPVLPGRLQMQTPAGLHRCCIFRRHIDRHHRPAAVQDAGASTTQPCGIRQPAEKADLSTDTALRSVEDVNASNSPGAAWTIANADACWTPQVLHFPPPHRPAPSPGSRPGRRRIDHATMRNDGASSVTCGKPRHGQRRQAGGASAKSLIPNDSESSSDMNDVPQRRGCSIACGAAILDRPHERYVAGLAVMTGTPVTRWTSATSFSAPC